jgi:tetratricopeptide (TPR) repeat protein
MDGILSGTDRWPRVVWVLLALLALCPTLHAQQGGDLQAQIVYAAESEDRNELASVQAGLRARLADNTGDAGLRYHLAHADYRQARLLSSSQPKLALQAAGDCNDQLKPLLKADGHNVEALILQSRCDEVLVNLGSLEALLLRHRAAESLELALRLAPRNPRALLVSALRDLAAGERDPAALARGEKGLRAAADLFTQSSATSPDAPGWGDSEAWVALGRLLLRAGDALAARNWIERALIADPDNRDARRARAELASR